MIIRVNGVKWSNGKFPVNIISILSIKLKVKSLSDKGVVNILYACWSFGINNSKEDNRDFEYNLLNHMGCVNSVSSVDII